AQVGGARLDIRGDVGGAHGDDADVLEQELALVGSQLLGVEAELREEVDGVDEQRAPGDRDGEAVERRHGAAALWAPSSCSRLPASGMPVPRSSPARAMCRRST